MIQMRKSSLTGKRVLIILPQNKFQDEEYSILIEHLKANFIEFATAALDKKAARGIQGTTILPDYLIDFVDILKFDAISLIGGVGSIQHWHSAKVIKLLKAANKFQKLICAICLAPVTLANAGLLKDKRVTGYFSSSKYLRSKGAIYTGSPVEIAGNIITSNGPEAAKEFAEAIINSLSNQTNSLKESETR